VAAVGDRTLARRATLPAGASHPDEWWQDGLSSWEPLPSPGCFRRSLRASQLCCTWAIQPRRTTPT